MAAGRSSRRRSGWSGAAGIVLALLLVACSAGSGSIRAQDASATTAAATAEEAVRQAVERDGAVYAGDCASTRSPQDVGKICSKFVDERNDMRAYLAGRTFSEFSRWVFVEQIPAGWQVAGVAPLDFFAQSLDIPWPR